MENRRGKKKQKSADIVMAEKSPAIRKIATEIEALVLDREDLILFAAAQVFATRLLSPRALSIGNSDIEMAQLRGAIAELQDVIRTLEEKVAKRREQFMAVQSAGALKNRDRAIEFFKRVSEYVANRTDEKPDISDEEIAREISEIVTKDASRDSMDQHFQRKNAKGDPYSDSYILQKVTEARRGFKYSSQKAK